MISDIHSGLDDDFRKRSGDRVQPFDSASGESTIGHSDVKVSCHFTRSSFGRVELSAVRWSNS
ncbi:MAG: hypothetical protein CMJ80_10720 [Planctomycetaceae bacterium]|nr:hypothetical protein [Planctomycetaceae bacterium]